MGFLIVSKYIFIPNSPRGASLYLVKYNYL